MYCIHLQKYLLFSLRAAFNAVSCKPSSLLERITLLVEMEKKNWRSQKKQPRAIKS